MIGVISKPEQTAIVEEFFELFKTPWEFCRAGRSYEVVVSTTDETHHPAPTLFISYGSERKRHESGYLAVDGYHAGGMAASGDGYLPLYGGVLTFKADALASPCLTADLGIVAVQFGASRGSSSILRVGFDLFEEVRFLLSKGQPVQNARIPALDVHIAILRQWIVGAGVTLLEIPPVPFGCRYAVCLTHDIDFAGIRNVGWDHTFLGFLFRASIGTLVDLVRGRRSLAEAAQNWWTLLTLPLIRLGLIADLWQPFDDYRRVEREEQSTFFLVPFKGRPGVSPEGIVDRKRAVSYELRAISDRVREAAAAGSELGVHGLDAWRDPEGGRHELAEVTSITGATGAGVRMHWLYFDADSPRHLESAGFEYDSTWGYNETIGYRAGTSQAFRLSGTERLMELPLLIMDSAMFSETRMRLSHDAALEACRSLIEHAEQCGGTLVINWHCRSLAPERLWGRCYRALLGEIGADRVWFATAREVVDWYRWRRSVRFTAQSELDEKTMQVSADRQSEVPGIIRVHRPASTGTALRDIKFDGREAISIAVEQQLRPRSIA